MLEPTEMDEANTANSAETETQPTVLDTMLNATPLADPEPLLPNRLPSWEQK